MSLLQDQIREDRLMQSNALRQEESAKKSFQTMMKRKAATCLAYVHEPLSEDTYIYDIALQDYIGNIGNN